MMVERSPQVENVGKLVKDLNQAAEKLEEISQKRGVASNHELKELIKVFNHFNTAFTSISWADKKFVLEEMNVGIGRVLNAIELFQRNQTQQVKAQQKNVEQAIVSLFSTLKEELKDFDKNLKNLKEYKIGQRVEKTSKSKQAT